MRTVSVKKSILNQSKFALHMLYYVFFYHKPINLEIQLTLNYFSKKQNKLIAPVRGTEVKWNFCFISMKATKFLVFQWEGRFTKVVASHGTNVTPLVTVIHYWCTATIPNVIHCIQCPPPFQVLLSSNKDLYLVCSCILLWIVCILRDLSSSDSLSLIVYFPLWLCIFCLVSLRGNIDLSLQNLLSLTMFDISH